MEEKLIEVKPQFKRNQAGGRDNIVNELVKYAGKVLRQRISKLLIHIWKEKSLLSGERSNSINI